VDPLAAQQILAAPHFWTQFSRPQVVQFGDAIYLSTTNMVDDTIVAKVDLNTQSVTTFTLAAGSGSANGHNSGTIARRSDGRLLAVWSVHNTGVYRRISTNADDISAWGSTVKLPAVASTSYANPIYLSTPNRWYVHTRYGSGGGPGDRPCEAWTSTDSGDSWGTATTRWLTEPGERPYVLSCNNGTNRVDFIVTQKHPTDTNGPQNGFSNKIYHCYMIVAGDGSRTFYRSDGASIGGSVTEISSQCTVVYDGASGNALPWDICYGADGHPRLLWVRLAGDDDHRHHFSRWTGSAWSSTEIGAAGARLYSGEVWSDGALCFDLQDPDTVYRSVQVGSAWELQQWETTDSGATWAKTFDISTGSGTGVKAVTPRGVVGGDGRVGVVWKKGTISNWDNFSLAVWLAGRQ
jgi:hypothetical protein